MSKKLTTDNHDRDSAGLKYVYPVISRRAGGLSIGINFNTNNACNWRCIYCQVPNLIKGAAPDVDLNMLEKELRFFLDDVQQGDFFERYQVDADNRVIKDIAISGNGEPTSCQQFASAIELVGSIAAEKGVLPNSSLVLITNGSLIHQQKVRQGLKLLQEYNGEVWFKLDSASKEGRSFVNNISQSLDSALQNLQLSASLCRTKIQTCLINYVEQGLHQSEKLAYLLALMRVKDTTDIKDIMLYTLARPSTQPEAERLSALPVEVMDEFAEEVRQLGFTVTVAH
ncbi:MAG: radical SAM protein [Gammaproteobacteria bacterium]|nr:radical SAM protein [Gammaproteobacteria bacterium]